MANLEDELKRILLAGLGAVAVTAEKAKEMIEDLVKKGELTVEQGKVLNEELKHTVKEQVRSAVGEAEPSTDSILNSLDTMSPEDIAAIKAKLDALSQAKADETSDEAESN